MYSISMSRTNCSVRLLATQGSEPALTRNTGLNDISAPPDRCVVRCGYRCLTRYSSRRLD